MWPKAISQLVELAPHITRLLPMADRFFQAKSADADASRTAMQQMADGLRGDLGQVTASHAGLYHQLNAHSDQLTAQSNQLTAQSEKLSTIATELHATRLSTGALDTRIASLERQLSRLWIALSIALLFLVALCVLSILILAHLH